MQQRHPLPRHADPSVETGQQEIKRRAPRARPSATAENHYKGWPAATGL